MSVFCPHIAISSTYANLELPVGFKPDDIDILVKATPDQRAVVINTGCVVLRALLEKKDELSEDEAFKKGKEEGIAAELTRWQREKKTLEAEKESQLKELNETVNRLQNESKTQKCEIAKIETKLTQAQAEAEALRESEFETIKKNRIKMEDENKSKLDWLSSELENAKKAAEKSQSEYSKAQQKFLDDVEKMSSTFRDSEEKLREKLASDLKEKSDTYSKQLDELKRTFETEISNQRGTIASMSKDFDSTLDRIRNELKTEGSSERDRLTKELKEAKDAADKNLEACREAEHKQNQLSVEKFSEIRIAEEKVKEEWSKKYEDLQNQYMRSINRQANSSTKGKDNEDAFAVLLKASFGTVADYHIFPKQNEYGDHVILWEQLILMFENKKYTNTVPKEQVEKALRDFGNHLECHVLIFVSEDSDIANHQRAGDLDITHTLDGRPAIWIGNFGLIEDKIRYLQLLGVVIRQLVRLQKREKQLENSKDSVDQKKKIENLRQYFQDTHNDLNELDKAHQNYQKAQNAAWKLLKNQMKTVIDHFQDRLKYVMQDGNDFESDDVIEMEEAESDAACKTQSSNSRKTHKTPVKTPSKAKKARNSEKPAITNFYREEVSEHQARQDALSGHNAELIQNIPE